MKEVISFLRIIRIKNLILIAVSQYLFRYYILETPNYIYEYNLGFSLIMIITLLIAASGYIINDVIDIDSDNINKKGDIIINKYISSQAAMIWYFILNAIAVICILYFFYLFKNYLLTIIFILSILLLFYYSKKYQYNFITGNLIVASLTSLSFINIFLFDTQINMSTQHIEILHIVIPTKNLLVTIYCILAFIVTFLREIIKDIEDIEGDKIHNPNNLGYSLSLRTSKSICRSLNISLLLIIILITSGIAIILSPFSFNQDMNFCYLINIITIGYSISLLIMIYYPIKLLEQANHHYEFRKISAFYKIIMMMGLLSIPLSHYFTYYCL